MLNTAKMNSGEMIASSRVFDWFFSVIVFVMGSLCSRSARRCSRLRFSARMRLVEVWVPYSRRPNW